MNRRVVLWACLVVSVPRVAPAQDALVIRSTTAVNVRTGTSTQGTTLVIREGRIDAIGPDAATIVPPGAQVIDGPGTWTIPGLIDVHTHTAAPDALRGALALGFTTVLTMYNREPAPDLESASESGSSPTPRVHLVAGRFTAGFPAGFLGNNTFRAPSNSAEADAAVEELRKEGFRRIKIWQDDGTLWREVPAPVLSGNIIKALVDRAHGYGMRVYVHAWTRRLYREALESGADWIIHPFIDSDLEAGDLELMKRRRVGWTSTLTAIVAYGDRRQYARRVIADPRLERTLTPQARMQLQADASRDIFPNVAASFPVLVKSAAGYLANARRAVEAGLTLALGSDETAGYGSHIEIELLAEAGLAPPVILRAATAGAAEALGLADQIGVLESGKRADLVLLDSDPLRSVKNLRDVRAVVKGGTYWPREQLLTP